MRIDKLPFKVNYFWTYKKDADLPEEIIIEKVLIYGDFEEIFMLEKIVGKNLIKNLWEKNIRNKKRFKKLNSVLEIIYGRDRFKS